MTDPNKTADGMWTPPKLVQWISNDFEKKGFPPPHRLQAEQIVGHALNISRLEIYLQFDKPCTKQEQQKVRDLVKRRYKREPTSYILGYQDFWSLRLKVGPGVLIPRTDTEVLIEKALEIIPETPLEGNFRILELGTGTAAIPLALCSEREHLRILSSECSPEAIRFASQNIREYAEVIETKNNSITLIHGDGFSAISKELKADMIISNPPYIPSDDIQALQNEVKDWEPSLALDGGEDGLEFYKLLFGEAENRLKRDGILLFEHGYNQVLQLGTLLKSYPKLKLVESSKDYSGLDRVMVIGCKN